MSNDLVFRLSALGNAEHDNYSIGYEAAEEIEALRRQVEIGATLLRDMNDEGAALNGANLLINTEVENKDKRIAELEGSISRALNLIDFPPSTIGEIRQVLRKGLKGEGE